MSLLIFPNALWLEGELQCVFLALLLTLALALTSALCLALPLAFVVALQNWSGQTHRQADCLGRQEDKQTEGRTDIRMDGPGMDGARD